jgi:hypothetical protein
MENPMDLVRANETRLLLLTARDLMTGRQSANDGLRSLRKLMLFEGKQEQARLIKFFETLGTGMHGELRRGLSIGQVESKLWLIDILSGVLPRDRAYKFTVIGGWIGLLAYLLGELLPEMTDSIQQLDIDPAANRVAEGLNAPLGLNFTALDKDALLHEYDDLPDVIVNTSCEHFTAEEFELWLRRLPAGRIVVLQSNNFYNEPGHVNCQYSVFKFRKSLNLQTCLFTGELEFEKYKRFMVIGITNGLN